MREVFVLGGKNYIERITASHTNGFYVCFFFSRQYLELFVINAEEVKNFTNKPRKSYKENIFVACQVPRFSVLNLNSIPMKSKGVCLKWFDNDFEIEFYLFLFGDSTEFKSYWLNVSKQ